MIFAPAHPRPRLAVAITAIVATLALPANATFAATHESADLQRLTQGQRELDAYTATHPDDFVGLDRLLAKYGAAPMKVRVSGIDRVLTAGEAQQVLRERDRGTSGSPAATDSDDGSQLLSIPIDAFYVAIATFPSLIPPGGKIVSGYWNFRDNYIGGTAPDDVAAITTDLGGGRSCFVVAPGKPFMFAYDYAGVDHSDLTYLYNSGVNGSPIMGIRDRVSGFILGTDHGRFSVQFNVGPSCTDPGMTLAAEFYYEHNQDGGSGFTATAGWGFFNISYNSPGQTLRKSSGALWA